MLAVFLVLGASASAQASVARRPIPHDAKSVIRSVHVAAKTKNYRALKALMVPEFKWSFGGDSDADQAIEAWKRDQETLHELSRVTRLRCSFIIDANTIQCPTHAGLYYRAGFTKTAEGWRMSYFVAGD
ncbi:hypothetical protein ACFFKC_14830 [Pseudoduganella danionis]|uniref:Nuclear transport factor 2 family protein n=1 Tax=Pseudoduganella danionis TaxID=1890295 RepID=A0ABW9SMS2_9BURK|nr:hypothetical protein [Pseudoduganella danionis]MTW33165.1 hypothetical protein [Pseudoduganella danionis]